MWFYTDCTDISHAFSVDFLRPCIPQILAIRVSFIQEAAK